MHDPCLAWNLFVRDSIDLGGNFPFRTDAFRPVVIRLIDASKRPCGRREEFRGHVHPTFEYLILNFKGPMGYKRARPDVWDLSNRTDLIAEPDAGCDIEYRKTLAIAIT